MKVIFLDIDGILNTSQTFIDIHNEYIKTGIKRIEIDLDKLKLLKEIVNQTGAVIVLSSTWRLFGKMENGIFVPLNEKIASFINLFNDYGLSIYDITPRDRYGIRQNEILKWLEEKNVDKFIIFDDDTSDLPKFLNNELLTCLNETKAKEAINKLTLKR